MAMKVTSQRLTGRPNKTAQQDYPQQRNVSQITELKI